MHDAYRNMGVAYNGLGKYQEAIDACKKAIEIKPDYHEAYNTMGIAYIGLRKHQKAIDINGFLIIALLVMRITKIKVTRR
jgi:tetratricopeptide (TPR) repeat protein